MLVKCPVCQAEYELEPGKYKCECGAKFWVLADGSVSLSGPGAMKENDRTNRVDPDQTMAPQTRHDQPDSTDSSSNLDKTVPNMRVRQERGELQVGDVILGRYELLEKLGSGAMGVVFKCRDRISGVEYALKMVPPELVRDAEAMEDVRENFKLVHGLKHQNIASMDFLDRDEYGSYFLIMEYVHGESLTQWIKKKWRSGRPDSAEVVHIVKQIAAALDYAHSQQILHRDIKPANVMVDDHGNVKVLDFGLASKVRSTMTALSVNPSNTSGTPNYLSPEQFKGKYPGPAADQFALGVLTYQMFAGHLPFEADDFNVLSRAVLEEEPDSIEGVPEEVNLALQRGLTKYSKAR
ncbi:MAG: serine/threonine protein kinase, partial [Lentisphaeria bacterium]|nr:serine/threonine protein kinase [Lentisphaeria bacterium]